MKRHLSGFGISALFHAGLALAALPLWLSQPAEPPAKPAPLTLALAQFQPAAPVAPQPAAKPEPKPAPQPIAKPITPPKPVVKTAVAKPKVQPVPKPERDLPDLSWDRCRRLAGLQRDVEPDEPG